MPKRRGKKKINWQQKVLFCFMMVMMAISFAALIEFAQPSFGAKQAQAATSPIGPQPGGNVIGPSADGSIFSCTNGAPVTLTGDPNNPHSIVIDNGIVRVTYPVAANPAQKGAMMLERKDSSGVWKKMLGDWYGDWTYYGVSIVTDSYKAVILNNSPDFVEVAFQFNHRLDAPGSYDSLGYTPPWWNAAVKGPCTVANGCGCSMGGCGVVARDFQGNVIYPHNSGNYEFIHQVQFVKTIGLSKCAPGYFVGYHTDPVVIGSWIELNPKDSAAERENGLGPVASVTFASNGTVVRNPEAGVKNTDLGIIESGGPGPWWFATLEPQPPAAGTTVPFPYVLYVAEEHPLPSFVWQFYVNDYGIPLVHKMNPQTGPDGRPKRYQTFIGALPYQMVDRSSEPTAAVKSLIQSNQPAFWPI